MAITQSDIDNLDMAIAQSELTVEVNGRRITYRSMDELLKARAHLAGLLVTQTNEGSSTRRGTYHAKFTTARGF
jgi:hypothetical protein